MHDGHSLDDQNIVSSSECQVSCACPPRHDEANGPLATGISARVADYTQIQLNYQPSYIRTFTVTRLFYTCTP